MRKYNITIELLHQCNGICPICKKELIKPVIDHNHKTGKVRGIVCRKCNCGLGLFNDDYETIILASEWVKCR